MGFIQSILNYILWLPCKWILELLNWVNDVVSYLASDLLESILFGGKVNDWNQVLIPATYYRIIIIAGVCWMIFLAVTFLCYLRKDMIEYEETPISKKILDSLKYSTFSAILLIFIPLFVWMLVKMTGILTEGMMLAFGAKNGNIADLLYNLGNPNWDGVIVDMGGNFPTPSDLGNWNMIVQLLGLCIVFLCLLLVMINIVVNTFTLFFYFILTGFYALTAVFDQGTRMKDYAKSMIANNLIICSSMLIFSIYASLISISFKASSALDMNGFTRMLLQLALAAGGGLFVVQGDQYVSRLVGENISGVSHAMNGLGMLKAGAMMAVGLGIGASKLTKRAAVGTSKAKGIKNTIADNFGGSQGQEVENQSFSSEEKNQQAKSNFVQGRQKAMQKYSKASKMSLIGLAGLGIAGSIHATKATKNIVGSMVGTKASRMMAREQLKQQTTNFKDGLTNLGATATVAAGNVIGGTIIKSGLDKTVARNKTELGNVYNKDVRKIFNDKLIEKFDKKINKLTPKNALPGPGINQSKNLKKQEKIRKIIDKKNTAVDNFGKKYKTKSNKWGKYADKTKDNKKNSD